MRDTGNGRPPLIGPSPVMRRRPLIGLTVGPSLASDGPEYARLGEVARRAGDGWLRAVDIRLPHPMSLALLPAAAGED